MFITLLKKEIWEHLLTFRFGAAMVSSFVLILLSVWILAEDHLAKVETFHSLREQYNELHDEVRVPSQVVPAIGYAPSRLSIFAQGESRQYGNFIEIERYMVPVKADVRLINNELLETVQTFDLQLVVTIILSLFAVLMSYDAFCGEREQGTLRLVLSYGVSRAQLYIVKLESLIVVITLPLAISLICAFLVLEYVFSIRFNWVEWASISMMFSTTILYCSVFIAVGMLCSTIVRRPSTSIIAAILVWCLLVYFIPLAANKIASIAIPLPDPGDISKAESSSKEEKSEVINNYRETKMPHFPQIVLYRGSMNATAYHPLFAWDASPDYFKWATHLIRFAHSVWLERANNLWQLVKRHEEKKARQARFARTLSVLSPAYHLRSAFVGMAGSGYSRHQAFLDNARRYRQQFNNLYDSKGYFSDNIVQFISRLQPEQAFSQEDFLRRSEEITSLEESSTFNTMDDGEFWSLRGELPGDLLPAFNPPLPEIDFEAVLLNQLYLASMLALILMIGLRATTYYDVR